MNIHKPIFCLAICLVSCLQASQELNDMIIKTDIDAIKKILPTINMTATTKQQLVVLANDIMLMRVKMVEIYALKNIKRNKDILYHEVDTLRNILTQQTIEEVKRYNIKIGICSFIKLAGLIGVFVNSGIKEASFIASLIGMYAATIYLTKIQAIIDNNLQQLYQDSIAIKQLISKIEVTI